MTTPRFWASLSAMMQLLVKNLEVSVSLGVYAWEQEKLRNIYINLWVDFAPSLRADALEETLDYDSLTRRIAEVAQGRHYHLIETMLVALGEVTLSFQQVKSARIEICKPGAVKNAENISITGIYTA